jgi:signal-transduction protein with cAMP-binding, CBS, and nucleotidyltransferase domain
MTLALRGHAFLSGLDEAQLAVLAKIAQPVQFSEQELILEAKQPPRDFYLLLSGSVSIELNKGHYAVRIQYLGPGDAFGCWNITIHCSTCARGSVVQLCDWMVRTYLRPSVKIQSLPLNS